MNLLDNELVRHPDCNCHQCTWLRASQIERAFIPDRFQKQETANQKCGCGLTWNTLHRFDGPCHVLENKPTPEPEKCKFSPPFINSHNQCTHKPKDEVSLDVQLEDKIENIFYNYPGIGLKEALRELVELARKK